MKSKFVMKTDFIGFLNKIPEFANSFVAVEKDFDWYKYFNAPNETVVPIYHDKEYALNKQEIMQITKEGFVVPILSFDKVCYGLIPFRKFVGYIDNYGAGDLIALFDFKEESLFEKRSLNIEDLYS